MEQHAIFIALVDSVIDPHTLYEKLADPDVGAHGWFIGVTRRTTDQQVTQSLSYQAHRPMAMRELTNLAQSAAKKFSLARVVIVHRLGEVPVGQASIVVGCSSGHRPETFAALAWIMDTLKREVPIWKRETFVDGTQEWVHPVADDGGEASREAKP
jgi:molybdopterin synthase catalytic subunit